MDEMRDFREVVRAVFDGLDLMAWAIDREGKILVSEGAALRAIGVEPGATVGLNAFHLYGDTGDSADSMRRALAGTPHSSITEVEGRTLETRYTPMRTPAGELNGMVGITHDITDRVRAQHEIDRQTVALREQAELLDLAHDAIRVRGLDGKISYWNHGAERIFGFTRAQAVGQDRNTLLHTGADLDLRDIERRLLASGYWEGELTHRRSDGQSIIVSSRWVLRRDDKGQPDAVLEIDTDITGRKQAEEAEARRQQEIIRAQALAIEELSTPLIPIADEILVMPLIGMMDSARAQQVMHSLLSGLATSRGKFAILDITGVPVVDTAVANAILRAAHAARLLGTEVILTGIRPEVAQTLVNIEANLSNLTTCGTLQAGIAYALARRGGKKL
ncbi:MAG: PAS domain S-box protein [Nannocystis sp.]|nr:PAS domain S-box protein [Nannocystis sp.]MBA3547947.1 PAS domain S-box protein [Nannocystis sp.]